MANKYEDIVNLQGAEAYRGGRPPTACLLRSQRCSPVVTSSNGRSVVEIQLSRVVTSNHHLVYSVLAIFTRPDIAIQATLRLVDIRLYSITEISSSQMQGPTVMDNRAELRGYFGGQHTWRTWSLSRHQVRQLE